MKIQRTYLKDQDYERKIFVDLDSNDVYRRIYIGFAWPYLTKPGFICVMAEEDKRDYSIPYGPRHLRILAEHEADDIENLSRHLQKFKEDFCQASIIGNNQNPLREIMEKYQEKHARLSISRPHRDKLDLTVFVQLIQKRTRGVKTLHFQEGSCLPGCLTNLHTEDLENGMLEQYPALCALGLCLSEMEFSGGSQWSDGWSRRSRSLPQSGWAV